MLHVVLDYLLLQSFDLCLELHYLPKIPIHLVHVLHMVVKAGDGELVVEVGVPHAFVMVLYFLQPSQLSLNRGFQPLL